MTQTRFLLACLLLALLAPSSLPAYEPSMRMYTDIAYVGEGGKRYWKADVVVPTPREGESGIYPLVIEIHGGGWKKGSKDYQRLNYGLRWAVKSRFVYARINYRFTQEEPFPAALHDVMNAVRFFRSNAAVFSIDPERIALQGISAGGHLALLAGYCAENGLFEEGSAYPGVSANVQATAGLSGVYDMATLPDELDDIIIPFLGGADAATPERTAEASPMSYVGADVPPTLIIHSLRDPVVPVAQAEALNNALTEAGASVRYVPLDSDKHDIPMDPHAYWEMLKWFREQL